MNYAKIYLNPKEEAQIRLGFPWVFDNEIASIDDNAQDGNVVAVFSSAGYFLGCGVLNRRSKIPVRFLSREREVFDVPFFERRIRKAAELRELYYTETDSYRLIFSEADLIPGLVVERFCDQEEKVFLCVQFLTLGAEVFKTQIIKALINICHPAGIYERSDVPVRELEGLDKRKGWLYGDCDPVITITENDILLSVDLANGQKTGYFLDQKDNRYVVSTLSAGRRVLDTFTHTGSFALNAVIGGASEVIAVDISEESHVMVEQNIALNDAGSVMRMITADVFDVLKDYERVGEMFDMIILDPPAFTKNSRMTDKAYGGYKEINLRAMKLLNPNGILVTCSCSHFFDSSMFYGMIENAAKDAKRVVQILEKRGAGPDHPILAGYPRSEYLKCGVLRVI
jgi:23S rRNA (cytosine1962-C5)-methyltransferase